MLRVARRLFDHDCDDGGVYGGGGRRMAEMVGLKRLAPRALKQAPPARPPIQLRPLPSGSMTTTGAGLTVPLTPVPTSRRQKPPGPALMLPPPQSLPESDEEAQTDRLLEGSRAHENHLRRRKRQWRTFVWLLLLLLSWGCWKLFNVGSSTIAITQRYDPAVGVDLQVTGCDIDFIPGKSPTIRYAAQYKAAAARWQKRSTDTSIVEYAHLENRVGCSGMRPDTAKCGGGGCCRARCLITISVPPEASASATFRIDQDSDDLEAPQVIAKPGAVLHELLISPKQMPRSIGLSLDHAVVRKTLVAKLGFAEVVLRQSALPADATVETVYSIYAFGVSVAASETGASSVPLSLTGGESCAVSSSTSSTLGGFESSGGGEVVVTSPRHKPALAASDSVDGELTAPQPKIAVSDADRLTKHYASKFGDRDSTGGAAYISFDIVGSEGVPRARFVYTTNPFFLILDPALLKFLTAGVLMPKMFSEQGM